MSIGPLDPNWAQEFEQDDRRSICLTERVRYVRQIKHRFSLADSGGGASAPRSRSRIEARQDLRTSSASTYERLHPFRYFHN